MNCKKCGGTCKPSKGYLNTHNIQTNNKNKEFETKLLDCIKCTSCGHSFIPVNTSMFGGGRDEIIELPIKIIDYDISNRKIALKWFDDKDTYNKSELSHKYYKDTVSYNFSCLTSKEIESIWVKEVFQKLTPSQVDFINKPNQKQFTQFSEELFLKYINKFSDKDKYEALRVLAESFKLNFEFNNSFTSIWNKTFKK